ncbi:MAG: general secretion pathway protein GspF, partial [Gammaproteobacteria bacterium]|nr:general secretion pathway protein GspF [Gammaproteobacteria bacterium]
MARFKKNQYIPPEAPLLYEDHGCPVSRRQFIRQGLMTGSATMLTGGVFGMFANPNAARAAVAPDLDTLATDIGCILGGVGAGQSVPFICFDLAGGANLAGSNVLVGQGNGQMDLLSTAGYSKLGVPGDMLPGQVDAANLLNPSNGDFTNSDLNLMFHADSPMLFGILEKASAAVGNIDGAVIPARSDNDTGNNPHNPLYALAMTGARGSVVDLIGSRTSDSGGNSMSPAMYIDPEFRPTKIDRFSDVTGLVDVGDLTTILGPGDVTAVMESITRVTHKKLKLGTINTGLSNDDVVKDLVRCGYLKAADIANNFAGVPVDPEGDPQINDAVDVNIAGIFTQNELDNDSEFRKTASVMKMVVNGYAAGGCITMGGYDYHTGDRRTGENRDLRAGRCIGACIDYARRLNKPLMVYVFSDGSVFSNGNTDNTANAGAGENLVLGGQGKGEWTGDNSSTACSYFLVFNPGGPPGLVGSRQIGRMSADASVVTTATPAANNV